MLAEGYRTFWKVVRLVSSRVQQSKKNVIPLELCIDKLMYSLKFKRKLYVPSSKDKFVIGTMTNAMHTMYIIICSVSTKIY